jgi:hypothetical protein
MANPFGGFTQEALEAYQKALAEREGTNFAEGDLYDFTTCVRPDGSSYGTRGKCRKGTEGASKDTPDQRRFKKTGARSKGEAAQMLRGRLQQRVDDAKRTMNKTKEGSPLHTKAKAKVEKEEARMEKLQRLREKVNAPAQSAGAPKRKLATSAEAKSAWQDTEKDVKSAKAEHKRVKAETKGDKSPEAEKKRREAEAALDKAERLALKASDKFNAARRREEKKAMTPEQRKQEREWNKVKKQYG